MGTGPGPQIETRAGLTLTAFNGGALAGNSVPVGLLTPITNLGKFNNNNTLLGDFNLSLTNAPLLSADGSVTMFTGTNVKTPMPGKADPGDDPNKRFVVVASSAQSPRNSV